MTEDHRETCRHCSSPVPDAAVHCPFCFNLLVDTVGGSECNLCNALIRPGFSRCPHCAGDTSQRIRPCELSRTHESTDKEVREFIEEAEDLFFSVVHGEASRHVVLGSNAPRLILTTLACPDSPKIEYAALLALRLCGYEVWGAADGRSHSYREPGADAFLSLKSSNGEQDVSHQPA